MCLWKNKRVYYALAFLLAGIGLNQATSYLIPFVYGELPVLEDILLDNLTFINICWLYDLLPLIGLILFTGHAYYKRYNEIPYFLIVFGIMQFLRGIFIFLTPLGSPNRATFNGITSVSLMRFGVFPSGHTGNLFLAYLLANGRIKSIILALTSLTILTLLLAKGHYSIDIFAALLFAYAVHSFGEKKLKKSWRLEGENGKVYIVPPT